MALLLTPAAESRKPTLSRPRGFPTLNSIQYLRGLAALAVVAYHALQWRGGGFDVGRAGVDVFFVISGFIMWSVTSGREISSGAFLWRRVTRVAPLYWIGTLGVFAMANVWPAFLPQVRPGWTHLLLSLAFIPHLDPRGLPFPTLPPGWTLDYEAMFYLVFAVALAAPSRWRAKLVIGSLTALVASGFVFADPIYFLGANPMLLQFAAGLALGVAAERGALSNRPWGAGLILCALAVWVIVQMGGLFSELWRPLLWGAPATLLVAGALGLELGARRLAAPGGAPRVLAFLDRVALRLGGASYAIYIVHLPAVAIVAHVLGPSDPAFLPAALAAAVAAGLAARKWLELPLLELARGERPAVASAQ